ncbi:OmpA family protein [Chitinophagaceae bacterium LWZ2-11]
MKKILWTLVAFPILFSCKSLNKTQIGTGTGVAAGAAVGALLDKKSSITGALIGAAIGGTAGYFIGKSMDKQTKELKQAVPSATIERQGEGINITFDSGLLFAFNSDVLSDSAKANLSRVASVFVKYPETNILIEGHTDSIGKADYNMKLSQRRAQSVSSYLESQGVSTSRVIEKWYGATQPKYPNDTEEHRALNRRVEVAVYANDNMKNQAQSGQLNN